METMMRIFTVTYDGRPAAVVRAAGNDEAIAVACELAAAQGSYGIMRAQRLEVREPDDAEMVSWLERRDHLLAEAASPPA
jgi:hypothetical protein